MSVPTEEEVTLQWQKFAAAQTVSRRLLEDAEFEMVSDFIFNTLSCRLSSYILEHKLDSATKTYSVPATWWDHFKRDVLRDRLGVPKRLQRFNTVTKTVKWEKGLYFPDAEYPKQLGEPVRFIRRTDNNG